MHCSTKYIHVLNNTLCVCLCVSVCDSCQSLLTSYGKLLCAVLTSTTPTQLNLFCRPSFPSLTWERYKAPPPPPPPNFHATSDGLGSKARNSLYESMSSLVLLIHLAKNNYVCMSVGVAVFPWLQWCVQVEIDLSELQVGQRYKTWYRLQHHEPKQKEKK